MDLETIRRVSLARLLFEIARSNLRGNNDLHLFAAVNLMQDAVEVFLIAVGEHVRAGIDKDTKFDKYFLAIDKKIEPRTLPFKVKMLRLNQIRIGSKHFGIQPAREECERLAGSVKEFFDEVSSSILGVNFSTVSALDILEDGDVKAAVAEAKSALEAGDLAACVVGCRKVIHLEVERHYSIAEFSEGAPTGMLGPMSRAPYYARNKEYIQKSVKDPTDYVVLDHSQISQELLGQGVDITEFWNIWRLTPEVFRERDGSWVVKQDLAKLEPDVLAANAEYVFNATVDFAVTVHGARRRSRVGSYGTYQIKLKRENVPVYVKASRAVVARHTPPGMRAIGTTCSIQGLEGDGPYWEVMDLGVLGKSAPEDWVFGYIHNDDVEF